MLINLTFPFRALLAFAMLGCVLTSAAQYSDPLGVGKAMGIMPKPIQLSTSQSATPPQLTASQPEIKPQAPQQADYQKNAQSATFGANLFTGAFARQGATQFNPDYAVAVGDKIQLRFWGAFNYEAALVVDPKGNIFLPNVGPIHLLGVKNQELQKLVDSAVAKSFKSNVFSYASLAEAQPVRIFVGGFVNRPGLYNGTSMDSLLHFLDQAGGIDPDRGTFIDVQVKRAGRVHAKANLYDFMLNGIMPMIQLSDGDVLFVPPRQYTVMVGGLVQSAKRFEFQINQKLSVQTLAAQAKPQASATHLRITRNTGTVLNTEYYPLVNAAEVNLGNGDELEFTADKQPGTITVRVEGEHNSSQEYVLPYGTHLGQLMNDIQLRPDAEAESIQLFRQSVKQRQKEMLAASLRSLEAALLTARSGSSDEARLRKEEADLTLQWVERAKNIEPLGQVQIAKAAERNQLLLENGDLLRIPRQDGLVLISGEVLFPNAVAFDKKLGLADYINRAGGYTQSADNSRVVVARRDGSFEQANPRSFISSLKIRAGDQVLVLPKVDEKDRQFWKDMTQVIYQIAVSAKVVLGL
jgi:protein involved in polysaccharide export with SLBB domain